MVTSYFKSLVLNKVKDTIADQIANEKVSVLDISASISKISDACKASVVDKLGKFGMSTVNFVIESITVPQEEKAKINKKLSEKSEDKLPGDDKYTPREPFDVLESTARKEEGIGGKLADSRSELGVGLGAAKTLPESTKETRVVPKIVCPSCKFENPSGVRFCGNCGAGLEKLTCPSCKFQNQSGVKFCGNCGISLLKIKCAKCGTESEGMRFCSNCGHKLL
jgi:membrane protease subunit (stomatin/prohibitin family)